MKRRIVKVTHEDGSIQYRCERTGLFRRNTWRPMTSTHFFYGCEISVTACFCTLEEAQQFLGIAPNQVVTSEESIWESK